MGAIRKIKNFDSAPSIPQGASRLVGALTLRVFTKSTSLNFAIAKLSTFPCPSFSPQSTNRFAPLRAQAGALFALCSGAFHPFPATCGNPHFWFSKCPALAVGRKSLNQRALTLHSKRRNLSCSYKFLHSRPDLCKLNRHSYTKAHGKHSDFPSD